MHFPKGEKYVSLLRNASSEDAQKVLEAERQRIRAKVKQQLADIAMITQADEGLPQATQQPADPVKPVAVQQVCTLSAEDTYLLEQLQGALHAHSTLSWEWAACVSLGLRSLEAYCCNKRSVMFPSRKNDHLQGLPGSVTDKEWAVELTEATLSTPGLEREALQSAQPIHALEQSSQLPLKRHRHEKSSSPGETGAVLKSKGVRSDERSAEPAAIGTFEEDEFFMSSSGTDDDGSGQHTNAASPPALVGALLCAPGQNIDQEQAKQARGSVLPHHNDSRQVVKKHRHVSSAGLATSQQPFGRPPAAGERKAVKHQGRNSKAGSNWDAKALSTSRAAPAGKSSVHSAKPVRAVAKSKDAEARPSGQPVRTRAEGGRKRRKKN